MFEHQKVKIRTLFHNCIVEQVTAGKSALGKKEKPVGARRQHITGLVQTRDDLKKITDSKAKRGSRLYPNLMHTAETSGRVHDIVGLLAS